MGEYKNLFKTDFFNGIISLSKKTWLKITYAYAIYYGAAMIIAGIFAAIAILGALDSEFITDLIGNPSPEDPLVMLQQISDIILTPEFIIAFAIMFIVIIILASWNYYFAFLSSDTEVNGKTKTFAELFKLSLTAEVFKLVGIILVLNIIITLMFVAAAASTSFSGILALLMFLIACVVSMRFILVLPAFVIGNYDFNSAFAFSFYHINWARAIKFFGISVLAMLVILGVSVIIGIIGGLISLIPIIGALVQIAINILLGAIMMTITVSALVGLYYRYADLTPTKNETQHSDQH